MRTLSSTMTANSRIADFSTLCYVSPVNTLQLQDKVLSSLNRTWNLTDNPQLLRNYGDTDFITGLRAIAATMVVMIHTGALVDFGAIGHAMTYAGKYGVDIFFVISGFTIAKTFTEAKDYRSYLTRRIMRIVPLYWLIITIAMALIASEAISMPGWMQKLGSQPDLYNYVMHLSMISYLDYRVANSVLGVEWTIPIEVFWYVFLPPLIHFGKMDLSRFCAAPGARLSHLSFESDGAFPAQC